MPHRGGCYLTISGCGTFLFELLREERERHELVAAVLATFEIDEDTAGKDVDAFVRELSDAGLLVI